MNAHDAVRSASTFLFVPADRPERFVKAAETGAGLVILDLEDAVAPENKDEARANAAAWAATGTVCAVRVNAAGSPWHDADLAALAPLGCALVLPKAQDAADVRRVADAAAGTGVIALIETARGILDAAAIAGTDGVDRLAIGTFDLAAELGVDPADREALLVTRTALVLASAAAGLPGPVDGVTAGIDDPERLTDDATHGRRLGFTGKLCIHPRQVAVVAEALRPSAEEHAWAESVIAAAGAAGEGGVAVVNGAMVDKPVLDRATRILQLSV